ncbi:MAG: FecR domain-containing protein [Tannerellaceae bacterium]|nr:FecR domain-containing protein [Tannerellaceae bacterium]
MWSASAAVLLIVIGFSVFLSSNPVQEEIPESFITYRNSSQDSIQVVTLMDGTRVWLSEQTSLACPEHFSGETRHVYLEGEAYFEVAADSLMPFLVKTDANQIKVFGTSFSVNTRHDDQVNEVILTSGSVQLQRLDGIGLINLNPGQKALYSKVVNTVEIHEIDMSLYGSWKYGLISLSNAPLSKILHCLENTYQVKIQMDTTSLRGKRYHFSFKRSKGIRDALDQLSFMTGVPAEIV